jgi:dolichyl-phosphate beta-glucosyltransferase
LTSDEDVPTFDLEVVLPAYQKGPVILKALSGVIEQLDSTGLTYRQIVVIDGDVDGTADRLNAAQLPNCTVICKDRNTGKGDALRCGIKHTTAPLVALFDADLDIDPEFLNRGLVTLQERGELSGVVGSKRHPDSVLVYPVVRRVLSTLYFLLAKALVGVSISDTQTGAKLFRGDVLRRHAAEVRADGVAFDLELLAQLESDGNKIAEVPIRITQDLFGSSMSLRVGLAALNDLLSVRRSVAMRHERGRGREVPVRGQR